MGGRFHERFNIAIDLAEANRRFINRFYNLISGAARGSEYKRSVADALGQVYVSYYGISYYIDDDFMRCIEAIECIYKVASGRGDAYMLDKIKPLVDTPEIDLGVKWKDGIFVPSGAALLDEKLINESLEWLSAPEYLTLYNPFEKGLTLFLKAEKHPELLYDVVTDMYEALEALAAIITDRSGKDFLLTENFFLSKIQASAGYKRILREYIEHANDFRHAVEPGKVRPTLTRHEVENFMYLTGLFLGLALKR